MRADGHHLRVSSSEHLFAMMSPLINISWLFCLLLGIKQSQAQSFGSLLPEGRLASSPGPGGSFLPVVVYQSVNTNSPLVELRYDASAGWKYGALTDPDADYRPQVGTPLTSVLYTTGQIYLYYVSTNNQLVERVRSTTGQWSAARYMNRSVYPNSRGLTSFVDPTGQINIWYQDSANTIKRCLWRSAGCLDEASGAPSINNVLPGSDIASFQDDVQHQHIYYQSADIRNPIKEMAWSNNQWNLNTLIENAPLQVSFESMMSTIQPGVPEYSAPTSQFWQLNQQIYNQVTMTIFSASDCGGWCYAKSLVQTRDYTAPLTVTNKGGAVRAYFVTADGKLGELSNVSGGNGWSVLSDLLAVATV
ncbi:hypothetical protein GQ53DRAFT_815441 [Thozetella sp. PMI_491]|nr:hypothetical protein GQ53DRAFT_815441 [Thozetella sp. PMI_491]